MTKQQAQFVRRIDNDFSISGQRDGNFFRSGRFIFREVALQPRETEKLRNRVAVVPFRSPGASQSVKPMLDLGNGNSINSGRESRTMPQIS